MAAHGARRLRPMIANLFHILGVEFLCAARGIEFRAPMQTSAQLSQAIARLRQDVSSLGSDRYMAPDLVAAKDLVTDGAMLDSVDVALPELA